MTAEATLASYAIWLVRIVLPILLFFFWYRTQAKGEGNETRYSRSELLGARQAGAGQGGPPEELEELKLFDEAQLQKYGFGTAPARTSGATRREGGGAKGAGKRGADGGKAEARTTRSGSLGGSTPGGSLRTDEPSSGAPPAAVSGTAGSPEDALLLSQDESMHFESLLNFVAFSHKKRPPRVFLVDKDHPPPPPPPPRPGEENDGTAASDAAKANAEAQMVLKGLVNPKVGLRCSYLAKDLYRQLRDSHVQPTEATFSLIVEACANDKDLKSASEFLMQMEAAGFNPSSNLLDKVMDLYDFEANSSAGGKDGRRPLWSDATPEEIQDDFPDPPISAAPKNSLTALSSSVSLRPGGSTTGVDASPNKPAVKTAPWNAKRAGGGSANSSPATQPQPAPATLERTRADWGSLREDD